MPTEQKRPKPKAGDLRMWHGDEKLGPPHPAQFAPPPFAGDTEKPEVAASTSKAVSKLAAARRKVEALAGAVRDEAFDDWVRRYVAPAEEPSDWTRARLLYENYLHRARLYGSNRTARAEAKLELATETQWGRMMGSVFTKKRRPSGWFYPVRLKRGA